MIAIISAYYWAWPMLASTVAADPDPLISGKWIINVIPVLASAIVLILGKNHFKAQGAKEAQQVGPQPFIVQMTEEFVTRREFVELKSEIRMDVTDMKHLFEKTMNEIKLVNTSLSEAIEDGIKEGRMGRVALWNEVNPQGKEIAALKATSDVAVHLGKLAEAIKTNGKNPTSR